MATFFGLSEEEMRLFLDETGEHLDTLETELLAIEDHGSDADRIGRLFRAAHTIKGTTATVGLEGMAALTHQMETIFEMMRCGSLVPKPAVVTLLLQSVDYLRAGLLSVESGTVPEMLPAELLNAITQVGEGEFDSAGCGHDTCEDASAKSQAAEASEESCVRVTFTEDCQLPAVRALQVLLAMRTLGDVFGSDPEESDIRSGNVQDHIELRLAPSIDETTVHNALQRISDIGSIQIASSDRQSAQAQEANHSIKSPRNCIGSGATDEAHQIGDRTIRVDVALLDDLMNLVGELVIDRGRLGGIGQSLGHGGDQQDLADELGRVTAHLARVTGSLQETVLKARMLPVKLVFRKLPRMVRDVAQQLGKQVDFRIIGEETELDRSLLEVISDPLMHLVRNALDHGIESQEERRRAGKPDAAVLQLSAGYEENQVVILVQDDGRGIDPDEIRAAAVRKGVLTAERARELGENDAIQLLFSPGFSTTQKITDISGRGVGLDVVRRNIERVGGRIEVESQIGQGSTFRLLLPLTLATIQSLLISVGTETLALPLSTTAEVMYVDPAELALVSGCWMTRVRGRVVPLVWLEKFMNPSFSPLRTKEPLLAVLVNYKGELVGLIVDRLIGEQEVVVKGLGEFFGQMKGISGVTILGDGSLALILDTAGLVSLLMTEIGRNASVVPAFPETASGLED